MGNSINQAWYLIGNGIANVFSWLHDFITISGALPDFVVVAWFVAIFGLLFGGLISHTDVSLRDGVDAIFAGRSDSVRNHWRDNWWSKMD